MELEHLATFDPRDCISGKVMRIHRLTANIFRKHLQPYDITNSQLSLLFILSKFEKLTQKQLSEIAVLEKSTLNRNLKRLFERGYASRQEFPLITITREGKIFVNDIIPAWQKAMDEITEKLQEDGEQALDLVHQKLR